MIFRKFLFFNFAIFTKNNLINDCVDVIARSVKVKGGILIKIGSKHRGL